MDIIIEFTAVWEIIELVATFVFGSNVITICLPNKADTKVGQFILDLLNMASFNFLKNKNHHPFKDREDEHKEYVKTHKSSITDRRDK